MSSFLMRLTDIGLVKDSASLLPGGAPLDFYQLAVGDGAAEPDYTSNALQNEVWRGLVSSVELSPTETGVIQVTGIIPTDVGGFYIRELGFFDQDGDMIALVKTAETQRLAPGQGQLSEQLIVALTKVSNVETVQFVADPNIVTASKAYVDQQIAKFRDDFDLNPIEQLWRY